MKHEEKYKAFLAGGLSDFLQQFGFRKKGTDFVRSTETGAQYLSTSLRKVRGSTQTFIQISVGFDFDEVEVLAAELQGVQRRKGFRTVSRNLGLLTSSRRLTEWELTSDMSEPRLLAEISECITEYALPFLDEFSNLNHLIEGYENQDRRIWAATDIWRLYAAHLIQGNANWVIGDLERKLLTAKINREKYQEALEMIRNRTNLPMNLN